MAERVVFWRAVADFRKVREEAAKTQASLAALQAQVDATNTANDKLGKSEGALAGDLKAGEAEAKKSSSSKAKLAAATSKVSQAFANEGKASKQAAKGTDEVAAAAKKAEQAKKDEAKASAAAAKAAEKAALAESKAAAKAASDAEKAAAKEAAAAERQARAVELAAQRQAAAVQRQADQIAAAAKRQAEAVKRETMRAQAYEQRANNISEQLAAARAARANSGISTTQVGLPPNLSAVQAAIKAQREKTGLDAKQTQSANMLTRAIDRLNTEQQREQGAIGRTVRAEGEAAAAKQRVEQATRAVSAAEAEYNKYKELGLQNTLRGQQAYTEVTKAKYAEAEATKVAAKAADDFAAMQRRLSSVQSDVAAAADSLRIRTEKAAQAFNVAGGGGDKFINGLGKVADFLDKGKDWGDSAKKLFGVFKIGGLGVGIYELVGAISALISGLFALGSAAAPAVASLAAIGPVAFSLGGAFATVKLAFSGVFAAVKQYISAQQEMALNSRQVANTQIENAQAIANAQYDLALAQRNVAVVAHQGSESLVSASHDIIDAQFAEKQSQYDLNQARIEAVQNIINLRNATIDAALAERGANLSLQEAQQNLQNVLSDPTATQLQIAQARLQVDSARQQAKEAVDSAKQQNTAYRIASKAGIESSMSVQGAKHSEADALFAVSQAQLHYRDTVKQVARDNQAAIHAVVLAQQALASAERNAALSAYQAQSGMNQFRYMLSKMGKPAQNFVHALIGMRKYYYQLKDAAGAKLFPQLQSSLKYIPKLVGPLKNLFLQMGGAVGTVAKNFLKMFASARFITSFNKLSNASVKIFRNIAHGVKSFFDVFRIVFTAAIPLAKKLTKGFSDWAQKIDDIAKRDYRNNKLSAFLDRAYNRLHQIGQILKHVIDGIYNMGKAASPAGESMLTSLGKITTRFDNWTKSFKGQNYLKKFFWDVRKNLEQINKVLSYIIKGFFKLGASKNVGTIAQTLGTLLKTIAGIFKNSGATSAVSDILSNLTAILSNMGRAASPLHLVLVALDDLTSVLAGLSGIKYAGTILNTIAAGLAAIAAVKLTGSVLGISRIFRAVGSFGAAYGAAPGGRFSPSRFAAGYNGIAVSKKGFKKSLERSRNRRSAAAIARSEANNGGIIGEGDTQPIPRLTPGGIPIVGEPTRRYQFDPATGSVNLGPSMGTIGPDGMLIPPVGESPRGSVFSRIWSRLRGSASGDAGAVGEGALGRAGGFLRGPGAALGLSLIASIAGGAIQSNTRAGTIPNKLGSALALAGTGATIGSFIEPGLGTAIGGALGGLVGFFTAGGGTKSALKSPFKTGIVNPLTDKQRAMYAQILRTKTQSTSNLYKTAYDALGGQKFANGTPDGKTVLTGPKGKFYSTGIYPTGPVRINGPVSEFNQVGSKISSAFTQALSTPNTAAAKQYAQTVTQAALANSLLSKNASKAGLTETDLMNAVNGSKFQYKQVLAVLKQTDPYYTQDAKSLSDLRTRYTQAGKAAKEYADSHGYALQSELKEVKATDLLSGRVAKLIKAGDTAKSTQNTFQQSLDAVTSSVKNNGKTLDANTHFGQLNIATIRDAAAAGLANAQAIYKSTGSYKDSLAALQQNQQALIAAGKAAGLNTGQIKDLVTQIYQIPKNYNSKISVDTEAAKRQVKDLAKGLKTVLKQVKGLSPQALASKYGYGYNTPGYDPVNNTPAPNINPKKHPKNARYATGGIMGDWGKTPASKRGMATLGGYTPGRDPHVFTSADGTSLHLSGGESILTPEATRAVGGARGVTALNAMASGSRHIPGSGGIKGGKFNTGGPLKFLNTHTTSDAVTALYNQAGLGFGMGAMPWSQRLSNQFKLRLSGVDSGHNVSGNRHPRVEYPLQAAGGAGDAKIVDRLLNWMDGAVLKAKSRRGGDHPIRTYADIWKNDPIKSDAPNRFGHDPLLPILAFVGSPERFTHRYDASRDYSVPWKVWNRLAKHDKMKDKKDGHLTTTTKRHYTTTGEPSGVGATQNWLTGTAVNYPYVFGAAGPTSFDCSGLVGEVWSRVTGHGPQNGARQMSTSDEASWARGKGFRMGKGNPLTDLVIGWYNQGSEGHTAGELAGLRFEARQSGEKMRVGGNAVSPYNSEFSNVAYLTPDHFAGASKLMKTVTTTSKTAYDNKAEAARHPDVAKRLLASAKAWANEVKIVQDATNSEKTSVAALRKKLGLKGPGNNAGLYDTDTAAAADHAAAHALGISHPEDWPHPWAGPVSPVEQAIGQGDRYNADRTEFYDDLYTFSSWGLGALVAHLTQMGFDSESLKIARSARKSRKKATQLNATYVQQTAGLFGFPQEIQDLATQVIGYIGQGTVTNPIGLRQLSAMLNVPDFQIVNVVDFIRPILEKTEPAKAKKFFSDVSKFQQGLFYANTGGIVPGQGTKDTQASMLTPGEGVLSKMAMRVLGKDNFHRLNDGLPPLQFLAGGGLVGDMGLAYNAIGTPTRVGTAKPEAAPVNQTINYNTEINNPTGESAVTSMNKMLRRQSALGPYRQG